MYRTPMNIPREIDDYSHRITKKMDANRGMPGFPQLEDYGLTRYELDDYLFDKQVIIDRSEDEKTRYTMFGILFVLPFLFFSFSSLPTDLSMLAAIGCGLTLCLLYYLCTHLRDRRALRRLHNPKIERFIEAVLNNNGSDKETDGILK